MGAYRTQDVFEQYHKDIRSAKIHTDNINLDYNTFGAPAQMIIERHPDGKIRRVVFPSYRMAAFLWSSRLTRERIIHDDL